MKTVITLVVCFFLAFSFGCSSFESPFSVVEKFYKYTSEGKLNDAYELLTEDGKNMIKNFGGASALTEDTNKMKAKGGIKKIEKVKENVIGDSATVNLKLHYVNGSVEDKNEKLLKEKGKWKLAVSK